MRGFAGKTLWIIGASSGIGAALARELAAQGAQLALSARRPQALAQLADSLASRPQIAPCDVANLDSVQQAAAAVFRRQKRVDSVINLAALYEPMALDALDIGKLEAIVQVNVTGAFHVLHAILPHLGAQGGGQIALCASLAGYCGLPNGQPYSATKAAVINLAQSLRAEKQPNAGQNWDVKLINPGFVRTPLTDKNDFHMPLLMEPEAAAKALARGLRGRAFEIHFPRRMTFAMKALRWLPARFYFRLARK